MAMVAMKRGDGDDADLVKLYFRDIGRYPLLTKADEARLAQAIEAGCEAAAMLVDPGIKLTAAKARIEPARAGRRRRPGILRLVQPEAGGVHRQEVPGVGPAPARSGPRREPRPHPRRGEVRLAQGLQVLHLRHVVDPPGHHPRYRQYRPHDPPARPRRRHLERRTEGTESPRGRSSVAGPPWTSWRPRPGSRTRC